ncbi:MAG: aminodeoxychorismate lyase [Hydrogenophilales bacterium 32-62-9]|nr:MAG: aminodeoxychorismate lyase [Hydrogenophilales bacterium 32-62-9]
MIRVNGLAIDSIHARDRGLAYGDGVFRTLRTEAGQPVWWVDHYARLEADCSVLMLDCPDQNTLRDEVCRAAEAGQGVVKIILTRGVGMRGYAVPEASANTCVVLASAMPQHAKSLGDIRARWCELKLARQPRLAGAKHLNRLENVLARAEWNEPDIFEGLLCDDQGAIVSGVMSNVFWAKQGELFTPDLSQCGVAGVARMRLLRAAARRGIRVHIDRFTPADLLAADEVMICNSLIGVRRVARLDDTTWLPAGWTLLLNDALYDNLD